VKIGIDIGGVISKYPDFFRKFIDQLIPTDIEIYIVSDMHDKDKMIRMLNMNGICVPDERVISANYAEYGEHCKTKVCEDLGLDVLIDDFIGYVANGKHMRLLVMPNADEPYYHDSWKTDGGEGDFGRRRKGKQ
jgi:hypothetical protein